MTSKRWDFLEEVVNRMSLVRTANGFNTEIGQFIHRGKTIVLDDGSIYQVPVTISDYEDYPYTIIDMLDGVSTHDGRQAPFHLEMNLDITGVIWAVDNEPLLLEQVHEDLEQGFRFDKVFAPGVQTKYRDFRYNQRMSGEHMGSVTIGITARVPYCFEYPAIQ